MHRKQDSDLLLADTELERTLRSLRKTKRAENAAMADERHDQGGEDSNQKASYYGHNGGFLETYHSGRIFCNQTAYYGCK